MTTTIKNSNLNAEIKHLGAELVSLKTNLNKEYIWEGNPDFWGKHSPILFPIVGTLKNNSFHYGRIEYHLSRHGFARDMEFELVDKKENSATFSIQSSEETLKMYPFAFELQIIYTLEENNLGIEYKVINNGKSPMPFSIGAHPAFALPGKFENYSIAFEKDETLEYYLLENDLISNKTKKLEAQNKRIPLTYELFKNDALIFKTLESNSLTILENENPILRVHFEDFPSLGIWTKMNAPFLCIEPWFGYSDTNENFGNLFEKEGIQILQEKDTFKSKFSIEIL
ncbi:MULTISPECIES: aldose 1-epimerase family protein [Flavobacterium]|uniref:Aldose 1-epimerase family protein n=1 Tax=Flavobacterium gawalongense TaxID=2594432 RepID=A0A553BRX4_9FLAO|nr:aldose 1-epimerase family protein [Flavobacterium gawalongense]TRX03097.1 aldose 1-epimerase family protein [Flavobacterium gawalongense]TRX09759.1 aldose 1-epimerase family protein [Flavobacterium gawalongense]TRX10985.1 aldose 1-epimerase family protein [Flavobacterium gawalongense]TRX12052.1 aldose 1-epimerase family protein [Flavobacterium gawalongense]TRX29898.1 aldose 1-epimerase family protein [Flavobacterium gawalongense]